MINKHNTLLYSVPYQHYTNTIEGYFSVLKNKLQKIEGIGYNDLKKNIKLALKEIPKEKYKKIFEGSYKRPIEYEKKDSTRKRRPKNYK